MITNEPPTMPRASTPEVKIHHFGKVNGFAIKICPTINKPNAHPPHRKPGVYGKLRNGVLSARFDNQGRLTTTGRDRIIRIWSEKGEPLKTYNTSDTLTLTAMVDHTGAKIFSGDILGRVRLWKLD